MVIQFPGVKEKYITEKGKNPLLLFEIKYFPGKVKIFDLA